MLWVSGIEVLCLDQLVLWLGVVEVPHWNGQVVVPEVDFLGVKQKPYKQIALLLRHVQEVEMGDRLLVRLVENEPQSDRLVALQIDPFLVLLVPLRLAEVAVSDDDLQFRQ